VQTGGCLARDPGQWAADRRVARRLAVLFVLLFALFQRGHFSGTDEVGLFQVTASMYAGSLAVPRFVHTARGSDGRYYSHFSVGQSALALPFFALGSLADAVLPEPARRALAGPHLPLHQGVSGGRVEIFAVGLYAPAACALLVALFFLFERRLGVSPRLAATCAALLGATTYVAIMATFFLRHVSECVTLVGALYFYFRWRQAGLARDLWLGSALASATILVRLPASVGGPALAGYLGFCLWERCGRRWNAAVLRRALPAILVPLLAGLALSAASDQVRWGVPWNIHQFGTASAGSTPLYKSVYAALLSPGMSVFVYSPLLLLTPWTFPVFWRRHRAEAAAAAALSLTFLLVFSAFIGWTGLWSAPGPRYQLISTPLLLLGLGLWLEERSSPRRWAVVAALAAAGLVVQLAFMTPVWGGLVETMHWKSFAPKWSFLFIPDHSPIVGALRYWADPRLLPDTWLLRLARGWNGQPGAPAAAWTIFALWAAAVVASALALWRALPPGAVRSGPPAPG
jgi:hypothetical protein